MYVEVRKYFTEHKIPAHGHFLEIVETQEGNAIHLTQNTSTGEETLIIPSGESDIDVIKASISGYDKDPDRGEVVRFDNIKLLARLSINDGYFIHYDPDTGLIPEGVITVRNLGFDKPDPSRN